MMIFAISGTKLVPTVGLMVISPHFTGHETRNDGHLGLMFSAKRAIGRGNAQLSTGSTIEPHLTNVSQTG